MHVSFFINKKLTWSHFREIRGNSAAGSSGLFFYFGALFTPVFHIYCKLSLQLPLSVLMFAGFVLLSPPNFCCWEKKTCISVSTFSGTKRNRRRHILLCLNWIWGGFSTSQTVVDFSHLCRAPCCLHNPGHYGFKKKSPQFGAVRLFFFFSQDGKKTTVDLLIFFFFFIWKKTLQTFLGVDGMRR